MIGTIVCILVALYFSSLDMQQLSQLMEMRFDLMMICSASLFMFLSLTAPLFFWNSLSRFQQKMAPRIQDIFWKDILFRSFFCYQIVFFAYSFVLFTFNFASIGQKFFWMVLWVLLFGFAIDLLRMGIKRLILYSNPLFVLDRMSKQFKNALSKNDEQTAYRWLEAVVELAAKATDKMQVTLAIQALSEIRVFMEIYVREMSRVEFRLEIANSSAPSFLDRMNYLCVFICKRLEWIFFIAQEKTIPPLADEVIKAYGKLCVFLAKKHASLGMIPITFIEKNVTRTKRVLLSEVQERAVITLSETAKSLIRLSCEQKVSLRDLILTCIYAIESIIKAVFREKKETSPALFLQPFAEIGQLLGETETQNLLDREEILSEIRRVFTQFQMLEQVVQNLDVGGAEPVQDSSSSYHEDMPYLKPTDEQ